MLQEWTQQQQDLGEVVCVTLMHNLHSKTSTVEYVCPGVQNTTLTINNGLIEVEPVEVEMATEEVNQMPMTNGCEEEMQRARIVERSILENQTTEITCAATML